MISKELHVEKDDHLVPCLPKRENMVITKALGSKIRDSSGKEYVDLFSGIAVANVGHCHPEVVKAVRKQTERYMHVSNYYHNDVMPVLAEQLAKICPKGLSRVFFTNSGSEAVDGAVKFAKKYAYVKRRNGMVLVSLKGSFHGRLSLTLTLTGQNKFKNNLGHYACYPGVVYASAPYYYRSEMKISEEEFGKWCAEDMADLIDTYAAGDVAAVIVEPILGEAGIIVPPDSYLAEVQRICRERHVPLVMDEVQTGLARTGKMFACEYWDTQPSMMTVAKALGGGLPIGAIVADDEISNSLEEGDHFSTFGGNPVSCAAALAVLDVINKEKLAERALKLGETTIQTLQELKAKNGLIGDVRGKGLMIGVELVKGARKSPASKEASQVKEAMRKKGFLLGLGGIHKNVLRIQPPLIISEIEMKSAIQSLSKSLNEVQTPK